MHTAQKCLAHKPILATEINEMTSLHLLNLFNISSTGLLHLCIHYMLFLLHCETELLCMSTEEGVVNVCSI